MKINKFNEKHEELDIAEMLSEKFFEDSDNFGSEELTKGARNFAILKFYFIQLNIYDMEIILKAKDFIEKFSHFYATSEKSGIVITITLTEIEYNKLKEKLELDRTANKYNV